MNAILGAVLIGMGVLYGLFVGYLAVEFLHGILAAMGLSWQKGRG